ncbi:MAG TPA: HIT domain-containing protein [Ktedonobacterales bacterium]
MDQLWAPWRMAYINSGGTSDGGCIFCVKPQQRDDEQNLIVWRSERCFALMNLYPYNNGHLMIAPYEHVPSISELDSATLTDMMLTVQRCLAALDAAFHPHGYNMGINQGTIAGAGIADHTHFHVVPRWNGDTNFMPVLGNVKVMPEFLQTTQHQIREQLVAQARANGEAVDGDG